MSTKEYNKLVRDKIPNIIAKDNKTVKFKCIKNDETGYRNALLSKFYEESCELNDAIYDELPREDIIGELADIGEVFDALVKTLGISHDEILLCMKNKAVEKGTFEDGVFLYSVEEE